ncbi:hypothetical protein BAE44_0011688, partial [Dichanthelium oligosanthes]
LLNSELERFIMLKGETVQQMFDRLMVLTNDVIELGCKDWSDKKVTTKLLKAFSPRNMNLDTIIRRDKHFKKMTLIQLLGDLLHNDLVEKDIAKSMGHNINNEIVLNAITMHEAKSSKQVTKTQKKEDSSDEGSTNEEVSLIMKNFKRFFKKRGFKKGYSDKEKKKRKSIQEGQRQGQVQE